MKEVNGIKLKLCPFCGSENVNLSKYLDVWENSRIRCNVSAHCFECCAEIAEKQITDRRTIDAINQIADSLTDMVLEKWNKRAGE